LVRKGDVNPQSVYESRPTGSPENDYKRDVRSQIWLGFEFLGGWWESLHFYSSKNRFMYVALGPLQTDYPSPPREPTTFPGNYFSYITALIVRLLIQVKLIK
jgi:hypothetical protein